MKEKPSQAKSQDKLPAEYLTVDYPRLATLRKFLSGVANERRTKTNYRPLTTLPCAHANRARDAYTKH